MPLVPATISNVAAPGQPIPTRMDPDQVDTAAELADATACAGDRCGCAGNEESWGRALLRRGWDLSRKAAIAGLAATAAPVIAPPIIILSIAGVALSVPFAACLASLAATDHIMGALLPPAPPQPSYAYDLGYEESEQEFVDASEAPDAEGPGLGHWSTTEEGAVTEQNERFASSPLSREPRPSEELVPLLANEEGDSAEGEFAGQKSCHELFVPKDGKREDNQAGMEVDSEYITMEAPSPGDVSVSELPVSREEDSVVWRMENATVPAMESVQDLPVSDSENKTEDGKSIITVENESSKEMLLPVLHTAESSDLVLPILGEDVMVQRYAEGGVSVRKSRKHSPVSERGNENEQHKTIEAMPLNEVRVSELQGLNDDNTVPRKLEDEIVVEMTPQEEIRDTNPVTGIDVQLDDISTADPKNDSLQSGHRVPPELQATTESAYLHCTLGSNLTGGIVADAATKSIEGVERSGEEDLPSLVTVDDDKDLISSGGKLNEIDISGGITRVGSKPHADHLSQTTCVSNKEHGNEEVDENKCVKTEESRTMDDKVATTDMAAQVDHISKELVPDGQSTGEDKATMEMVLEEVSCNIDPDAGEVIEMEVHIIPGGNESPPLSEHASHELHVVTGVEMVDNKMEDIVKGVGDTDVIVMEHQGGEGAPSFVSGTSVLTVDDGEDSISRRSTPYASAMSADTTNVQGRPDLEHHHQTTGVEYKLVDRELETKALAEDKDIYTEEQLSEQLNTLRTITGYRAVPSLTLEGELAGLYIFVGVEPPQSSVGASDLAELSTKLLFLKSIIGVE